MTQLVKKISAILSLSFLFISCGKSLTDTQKKTYDLLSGAWSFETFAVKNASGTYVHAGQSISPDFIETLLENSTFQKDFAESVRSQGGINPAHLMQMLADPATQRALAHSSIITSLIPDLQHLSPQQRELALRDLDLHREISQHIATSDPAALLQNSEIRTLLSHFPDLLTAWSSSNFLTIPEFFKNSTLTFSKEKVEYTNRVDNQKESFKYFVEYHENSFTLTDSNDNVIHVSFEYIDNRLYIAQENLSRIGVIIVLKKQ